MHGVGESVLLTAVALHVFYNAGCFLRPLI